VPRCCLNLPRGGKALHRAGGIEVISNLQFLRAFAALGVVLYHANFQLVPGVHTDLQGVAIFFVVSGFIMCFITRDGADHFLGNRFVRIVPIYWLFTLLMFCLHRLSPWAVNPPAALDLPRSLLFLPSEQMPVLGVPRKGTRYGCGHVRTLSLLA
jgi:exopolysaccharide production protein ExoZ